MSTFLIINCQHSVIYSLLLLPVHMSTPTIFCTHLKRWSQCFVLWHKLLNSFDFLWTVCCAFSRQLLQPAMTIHHRTTVKTKIHLWLAPASVSTDNNHTAKYRRLQCHLPISNIIKIVFLNKFLVKIVKCNSNCFRKQLVMCNSDNLATTFCHYRSLQIRSFCSASDDNLE